MDLAFKRTAIFEVGINSLVDRLDELGLRLVVENDFDGLAAFLNDQNSFVNPTYSPEYSDLGGEDFWIRLLDKTGCTVACSAERTFNTIDFARMVARGTVWYRNGFADIGGPPVIPVLELSEPIRGKVGASGSTFTVPAWRRHGLALVMTWLTRLISFRDFGTTVNTGFVRHSLAATTVPSMSYGYDRIEKIIDGYFPPQRGPETLYCCWIDRAGMMRRVLDLPSHPINPMRLVAAGEEQALARAA